jgi:hypothetical protein
MEIMPPQLHMSLELSFNAGTPPTITVGEPGTQGAVVTGMQGIGVSTPNAAAVAVATIGLAIEVHIPKGGMLTMGMLSITVTACIPCTKLMVVGRGITTDGATPKLH